MYLIIYKIVMYLKIKATKSDELSTIISVIGKYFINSPMIPDQKANGKNAARVVAVEAIIGIAISPTAYLVALKMG